MQLDKKLTCHFIIISEVEKPAVREQGIVRNCQRVEGGGTADTAAQDIQTLCQIMKDMSKKKKIHFLEKIIRIK